MAFSMGRRSPPQSLNMAAPELCESQVSSKTISCPSTDPLLLLCTDTPLDVIGRGSFGLIRKVKRISDGKIFARKEICFDNLRESDKKQIVAEVNILRKLRHPHIVQYEERHIDVHKGCVQFCRDCPWGVLLTCFVPHKDTLHRHGVLRGRRSRSSHPEAKARKVSTTGRPLTRWQCEAQPP